MKANTFFVLLSALAPISLGAKFKCSVDNTVIYTDKLHIQKQYGVVKFLVGTGDGELTNATNIVSGLASGSEFHTNEIKQLNWKIITGIHHAEVITEGMDVHYVQFKYGLTEVENADAPNMKAFREEALNIHTRNRARHDVYDKMTLNEKLNDAAQMYANILASKNIEKYSKYRQGESVQRWIIPRGTPRPEGLEAAKKIQSWYSEEKLNYDFEAKALIMNKQESCRRFAAMIWKGTKELGIGVAYGKGTHEGKRCGTMFIVARYTGSYYFWHDEDLRANVMPELKTA